MQASDILFRCSGLGYLMTEPQGKSNFDKWEDACTNLDKYQDQYRAFKNKKTIAAKKKYEQIGKTIELLNSLKDIKHVTELSETTKGNLVDIFVSAKYKRREEITNKFLEKGNACEEDSITALSRVTKILFKKNAIRLSNEFVTGEPDLFLGESIYNAERTDDTKTSWSAHTFFRAKNSELDKSYYWQGMAYMWLTGAKVHYVDFCLVNGTAEAILSEKRKLEWNCKTKAERDKKARQIEINHIFDLELFKDHNPGFQFDNDLSKWDYDIPLKDRVFQFKVERDESEIERLKKRIIDCREWIDKNLLS